MFQLKKYTFTVFDFSAMTRGLLLQLPPPLLLRLQRWGPSSPVLFVLFFKFCVKTFLLFFWKRFSPKMFHRNIFGNPLGNLQQIKHSDTNTTVPHKNNMAIQMQIGLHIYNRAKQIQVLIALHYS